MSAQAPQSAVSAIALDTAAAQPSAPRLAAGAIGEAGSKEALARLAVAMAEMRALAVQPLLDRAVEALRAEDHRAGADWALKALDQDERNGFGWYLLAIARERAGDFVSSITAYETALRLLPDHAEVANDLGRLAYRIGMKPQAEKLFRHFLARFPGHHEGANNLACVLRDDGRCDAAIEVLKPVIAAHPAVAMLWNTMGTIVAEQGDFATAEIFFREAIGLEPALAKAIYNLGNARLSLGDPEAALDYCEQGLRLVTAEDERQMMRLARSTILMALGRIGEGWDDYEARLHPQFADVTHFVVDRPAWQPGADLAGKSLLVVGEQGLGDEILFANTLPDVIERLGPKGRLTLAVEPRLVSLFQRSFPDAVVGAHSTHLAGGRTYRILPFLEDMSGIDLWTPMGSLLREFRRGLDAFPDRKGFLAPDPARVAHWKRVLEDAPTGPKVGLLWKSATSANARQRFFSSFEAWAPVLKTEGLSFINLQYGDCSEELAFAEREFGARIWTPPGIDLKQDLDDVAALSGALDVVAGFANATFNLAAGSGVPAFLVSTPGSWARLGAETYPWYPQVRVLLASHFGDWGPVMDEMASALAEFTAGRNA